MPKKAITAEKILDTALDIADRRNWEAVRLHDVADELDVTLDDVRAHFRDKEDLVDAWFDRADSAMLSEANKPGFADLPTRVRLHRLIMAWLESLNTHRRVTQQMVLSKLGPGHLHVQIPAVLRINRTVQWMREAAQRDATFLMRAFEETVLTSIYVTAFMYWMRDNSSDSTKTSRFVDNLLGAAEWMARLGIIRPFQLQPKRITLEPSSSAPERPSKGSPTAQP